MCCCGWSVGQEAEKRDRVTERTKKGQTRAEEGKMMA